MFLCSRTNRLQQNIIFQNHHSRDWKLCLELPGNTEKQTINSETEFQTLWKIKNMPIASQILFDRIIIPVLERDWFQNFKSSSQFTVYSRWVFILWDNDKWRGNNLGYHHHFSKNIRRCIAFTDRATWNCSFLRLHTWTSVKII